MRKLLLMFLVSLSCFITPLSLYADNGDTETITDEETPEKGKKMYNQTYSCIIYFQDDFFLFSFVKVNNTST